MRHDSSVDGFLGELSSYLGVAGAQKRRILNEVKDHLLEEISQQEARGNSRQRATELALLRFGDPLSVARRFGGRRPEPIVGRAVRRDFLGPGRWSKRYLPFGVLVLGIVLAATILPSALNFSQANPSQTLEYAPVASGRTSDTGGSIAALGLGSTGLGPWSTAEAVSGEHPEGRGQRP